MSSFSWAFKQNPAAELSDKGLLKVLNVARMLVRASSESGIYTFIRLYLLMQNALVHAFHECNQKIKEVKSDAASQLPYRRPLLIPSPTSLLLIPSAALALSARPLDSLTSTGSGKSPNSMTYWPTRTPPDPVLAISLPPCRSLAGNVGGAVCDT
jgi:hypothetical protein